MDVWGSRFEKFRAEPGNPGTSLPEQLFDDQPGTLFFINGDAVDLRIIRLTVDPDGRLAHIVDRRINAGRNETPRQANDSVH